MLTDAHNTSDVFNVRRYTKDWRRSSEQHCRLSSVRARRLTSGVRTYPMLVYGRRDPCIAARRDTGRVGKREHERVGERRLIPTTRICVLALRCPHFSNKCKAMVRRRIISHWPVWNECWKVFIYIYSNLTKIHVRVSNKTKLMSKVKGQIHRTS